VSASTIPEIPPLSIACRICCMPMKLVSVKPSIEETVYAYLCVNGHRRERGMPGREISDLYLCLALDCFDKAATAEQADDAEALRRMGRRYVAEAAALDRRRIPA
jgi:hypothetical protein